MSYFATITELGDKLSDLVVDLSAWSQATFGTDAERGPVGPLKHLILESAEAQRAWVEEQGVNRDKFREELADCLMLVLDAARRGGIKPMQLIEAAQAKMAINKTRTYPKPIGDEVSTHTP